VEPVVKPLCRLADFRTEVLRHRETTNSVESFSRVVTEAVFKVTKIPEQQLHPDFCSSDIIVLRAV